MPILRPGPLIVITIMRATRLDVSKLYHRIAPARNRAPSARETAQGQKNTVAGIGRRASLFQSVDLVNLANAERCHRQRSTNWYSPACKPAT